MTVSPLTLCLKGLLSSCPFLLASMRAGSAWPSVKAPDVMTVTAAAPSLLGIAASVEVMTAAPTAADRMSLMIPGTPTLAMTVGMPTSSGAVPVTMIVDQGTWQSSSWHSQDEWRSSPWSSSGWQQGRPSWGRGNNKGKGKKGRGRGNKGRGKGWNQWSSSSWQQPKAANADTAAGSAVGSADDSWGNWGSGPAGAIAKAQPPVKKNVSATDAPVASAEPAEDEDPENDFWQEAINNALADPDRVPAVNEAWASGEIAALTIPADEAVALAADNFISLHPSLMDLPKSIGLRLFRALAMAEVEPDPQREILQWEGIGWKATFIPITVKPHAYFKDAAAEGALSYLTWGHGTDWKALPYILHERLVRPQSWEKGSLPSSGFFTQALNQEWSDYAIKHCVRRALAIPKRQQGPIILGQAVTPLQPAVISGGGNWRLHAACRVAGAARSPEAYCVKSCFAKLEGVAVVVPF